MNQITKKIIAVSCCIIFSLGIVIQGHAGSISATKDSPKMMFPVNNGGWTYVNFQETYRENYNKPNSSTTQFTSREKVLTANIAAATQSPSFNVVVAHFNSSGSAVKYFGSWSNVTSWFDGSKWNYWDSKRNSETRTYVNTAGYYGQMATSVSCSGSSMVYQPVIARINLK